MKKSSFLMGRNRLAQTVLSISVVMLMAACHKDAVKEPAPQTAVEKSSSGLSEKTITELNAARAATEKYRTIDKAVADGYADINVVMQNMGFHYMKAALVDTVFDPAKPELLVYNKQHDGTIALVAVEYAVPIPLMPLQAPEGFTGGADVWTYSTAFNLWLLHAWVWEFNPQGIFTPTNPNVHLH